MTAKIGIPSQVARMQKLGLAHWHKRDLESAGAGGHYTLEFARCVFRYTGVRALCILFLGILIQTFGLGLGGRV